MTNAQKLKKLLIEDVIPEVEEYMDDLFELIANKEATPEDKAELEEMREMRDEFKVMITEIDNDEIDEEESAEIIAEINAMRNGDDDEEE